MTRPTAWKPARDTWHKVACPLCGGEQFETLATTDRYDMDLVTAGCLRCGLVMTNPQPDDHALDEFYRDHYRHYYQKTDTPSLAYIREFRKDERAATTAQFLRDAGLVFPGAAVLDIGASEGCILKAIADLEPTTRRVAVEPNLTFGEFAVTYAGCSLHASVQALQAAGSAAFDLVIMNHVYEHVGHPVRFLAGLTALLTPAGQIYIDVPDVTEYEGLESLHIAHLYHFGPDTLARAAALAEFRVVRIEKHQPVMHPKSLRSVLRPGTATTPAPHNMRQGWDRVRQANRHAWHYHRSRWSLPRRLVHRWLAGATHTA
ncbi:MAG TPA: methyltransferase domain-containing protein [Burkholderiaceae bacterium]|nr:methyltransferase domain-containing protein [Burkholderiaceae bacterium]